MINDDSGNCMVEFNKITKDDWSHLMGSFRDSSIYQCWEYAEVHWNYCRRDHLVIRKDGVAASLAQVIILNLPMIRIAYVPWGPIWKRRDRPDDDSLFGLTIKTLKAEYVHGQKMALRIRPNGFEENDSSMKKIMAESGFTQTKKNQLERPRTILVDLGCSEIDLRKRLAKNWRNSLSHSEKEKLAFKESFDEKGLRLIQPLYEALKEKKKIEGVNLRELSHVQSRLSQAQKIRITLCENDIGIIAGSVCSGIGDTALGIVGVTSEEGRKRRAYYLLQWEEILWAKRNSNKNYDLNGINPLTNPSVYHFKSGLRGEEVTFLGLYDCYPNWITEWLVNLSDKTVKFIKKGNVIKMIKKLLLASG
jgi:lipid II:glycine glycyltransferase (peptidoglycan interpeptide bridge formation enzyme)